MKRLFIWLKVVGLSAFTLIGIMLIGQSAQAAVPQGGYQAGGSVGQRIAAAAEAQIGIHQDCTMLVTHALEAVGIHAHGWPKEYLSLGPAVPASEAQPGDLLYYPNGGSGMAHIAVYDGGGMAIHGGFGTSGQTVRFSVKTDGGYPSAYIRVRGGTPAVQPAPAPQPVPVQAPAPTRPAAQLAAAATSINTRVVASGETLSAIASSMGLDWHALWSANPGIGNPNSIAAGQKLNVPVSAAVSAPAPHAGAHTHVVAAGETLSSIAVSAGFGDWHALWSANPQIGNPDLVYAGQILNIPSAG